MVRLNNMTIPVRRECVIPMHTNASDGKKTFKSVMRNGVLSPKARGDMHVMAAVTTDDARSGTYAEKKTICVNLFQTAARNDKLIQDILTAPNRGAFSVALEDNAAPSLELPGVSEEELDRRVSQACESDRSEIPLEIKRILKRRQIREEMMEPQLAAAAEALKPILERRLLRTMLIIGDANDKKSLDVIVPAGEQAQETELDGLPPERFLLVLVPENGPAGGQAAGRVETVSVVERELELDLKWFCRNLGMADGRVTVRLRVPDYASRLSTFMTSHPDEKLCSHIVRL